MGVRTSQLGITRHGGFQSACDEIVGRNFLLRLSTVQRIHQLRYRNRSGFGKTISVSDVSDVVVGGRK
jgi:hypothetical protein